MEHPYKKYETTELWGIIETSIEDLIQNKDIHLTTVKEYVVGYLCEQINKNIITKDF